MDIVSRARDFAIQMHGTQRYGKKDYVTHLDAVANVLKRFGIDNEILLAAAYLHDTLEDTPVSKDILVKEFGSAVANIVELVTDLPGKNRAERHKLTYPRIAKDQNAVIVKIADRIANSEASKSEGGSYWEMYRKEYEQFRTVLFNDSTSQEVKKMWAFLDYLYEGKAIQTAQA